MTRKLLMCLIFSLVASIGFSQKITIDDQEVAQGETVTVDFKVDGFNNFGGMQFSINWDPAVLKYKTSKNFNTALADFTKGASINDQTDKINSGQAVLQYSDPDANSFSLPDGTVLFSMEFEVIGNPGDQTTVDVTDNPTTRDFFDGDLQTVNVSINSGTITVKGGTGGNKLKIYLNYVNGAKGSIVTMDVKVDRFVNVGGIQYTMTWDPNFLEFVELKNFDLDGLTLGSFNTDDASKGNIITQWNDPGGEGQTLSDGSSIYQISFRIKGSSGSSSVSFANTPKKIEFSTPTSDVIEHSVRNGRVTVENSTSDNCDLEGFAWVISKKSAKKDDEVCVDVSVKGFKEILTQEFTIRWDNKVLSNPKIGNFNLSSLSSSDFSLDNSADGYLVMAWFDETTDGITLDDGTVIFQICFDVIGEDGARTDIVISDDPRARLVSSNNGDLTPQQCNGEVVVGDGNQGSVEVSISKTQPKCNDDATGMIDITVTGGKKPYTFAWTKDGQDVGTTEDLKDIKAGDYKLVVRDADGKVIAEKDINLSQPDALKITKTDITKVKDGGDGAIDITVAGGTGSLTYAWSNNATSEDISDLEAGTFNVTITDENGCELKSDDIVVDSDGGGELKVEIESADYNGSDMSCFEANDAMLTAKVSGGKSPYTYKWSNDKDTKSISNLEAGSYEVTVTDADGTEVKASYDVKATERIIIRGKVKPSNGVGEGSIELNVTGGTAPYNYAWNNGERVSFISKLQTGSYRVTVTDANGCEELRDFQVNEDDRDCYVGRPVITPNGDGYNDELTFACLDNTENTLRIYDEWGILVFEQDNYSNDWMGRDINNKELPDGAYYYVLRIKDANGEVFLKKGHTSIIRKLN